MKRLLIPMVLLSLFAAACSSTPASETTTTVTFAPMDSTTSTVPETTAAPDTTASTVTTTEAVAEDPPSIETIPVDGDIVDTYMVEFVGRSETAVDVLVNGESVDVDSEGTFVVDLPSDLGENEVVIEATDAEGNTGIVETTYVFAPEDGWIAAIGDSVMLGSKEELEERIGPGTVDAVVSRQFLQAPDLVRDLLAREVPPQVIVIALGTNGPVQARHFDEVMEVAADVPRMVFVNAHVPTRNWEAETNRQLAEGVERYDNAVLVDWFTPMDGRSDLFAKDNFHPQQEGRVIYADLVAEAVFPNWASENE
jgi:lysophospholipase L1-like esterase